MQIDYNPHPKMKVKTLLSPILIIAFLSLIIIGSILLIQNKRNQLYQDRYQQANALLKDFKYEESLAILKNIYPKSKGEMRGEILYQIGICYQKIGNINEAEKYWEMALNSKHTFCHPDIYYELAQHRLKDSNFQAAQFYYSQIIEKFPYHSLAANASLGPADIYTAQKEFEKARKYCEEIIESPSSPIKAKEIAMDKLGEININLLFSRIHNDISEIHTVKAGENLFSLAKKLNTTIALLMRANNLQNSFIKTGQKLKTVPNKFSILVYADKYQLLLNYDGKLFKKYKIAVGSGETPTPLGVFKIREKLKDPAWYPSEGGVVPPRSTENLLGSRWMGLWQEGKKTSYGIHEAVNLSDIGKNVSNGCLRMLKTDLEELYDIVTIGTQVTIKGSE